MTYLQLDLSDFNIPISVHPEKCQSIWSSLQSAEYAMSEWIQWPQNSGFQLLQQIKEQKKQFSISYDLVLVLGIGGSYAGVMACQKALTSTYETWLSQNRASNVRPILFAGHHLCEHELLDLLTVLDSHRPLLQVISKSGTTTETSIAFRVLHEYMVKRFGDEGAWQRTMLITDPEKGALRNLASRFKCISYDIPNHIGGRYSMMTAVGMVPLAFAGYDVDSMMEGADTLFQEVSKSQDLSSHPFMQYAFARKAAWDQKKTVEIFAYNEVKLMGFVEWWKQLFAESEGKNNKGLFPVGMVYSTDLHSIGQYMQEGHLQMMETFIKIHQQGDGNLVGVENTLRVPRARSIQDGLDYLNGKRFEEINQAAMTAARMAHSSRGVPCLELEIPRLDAIAVGYLFSFFMSAIAVSALLNEVDPFDQPGVDAYKQNLFKMMKKEI